MTIPEYTLEYPCGNNRPKLLPVYIDYLKQSRAIGVTLGNTERTFPIRQLSACTKAIINKWKYIRTFCTAVLYLSIFNQGHNSSRLKFKRRNHCSLRCFCPKLWAKPNQTKKKPRNRNEMLREIQHNSSKVQIHCKYFLRVAFSVY